MLLFLDIHLLILKLQIGQKQLQSSGISTNASTITVNDHKFVNGERVYLSISSDSGISGGVSGYFYVNVVDENTFKLALNPSNLIGIFLRKLNIMV